MGKESKCGASWEGLRSIGMSNEWAGKNERGVTVTEGKGMEWVEVESVECGVSGGERWMNKG